MYHGGLNTIVVTSSRAQQTRSLRSRHDVIDDEAEHVRQEKCEGKVQIVAFASVAIQVEAVDHRNGNPGGENRSSTLGGGGGIGHLPVQIANTCQDVEQRDVVHLKVLVQRHQLVVSDDAEPFLLGQIDIADVNGGDRVVRKQVQCIVEKEVEKIDEKGQSETSSAIGKEIEE